MSTFSERFLFFSTNPRSPIKTQLILKTIKKYQLNGLPYNQDLQLEFYKDYTKNTADKGGQSKNPTLSGRQLLTRAPQALGLLRARSGHKLMISKAGEALIDDDLYEDTILHQMLKFQLPSPLHHEKKGYNKGLFNIKPFLELTRLIDKLGYLTYEEFMIYGMTLTDYHKFDATVDAINSYRKRRNAIKGVKSLREFDKQERLMIFKEKYSDLLAKGNFKTRESATTTAEAYIKKKLRNCNDYADAIFRLLHESGLIVATGHRTMRISPRRQAEVDYILENVDRDPMPESTSREAFDEYMFDPAIPLLKNDSKNNIIKYLSSLNVSYDPNSSLTALKKLEHKYIVQGRQHKVDEEVAQLKKRMPDDIDDIVDVFNDIQKNRIQDAPTMMEWNTWRAVTMIDHGNIKGNFVTDDEGHPRHTAAGGQGDIVGNYSNFNIVYEVTMSTGSTQYNMESEPVTRHVGSLQKSSKMPTYGIFIAKKLNKDVINFFRVSALAYSNAFNGTACVIPFSLDDFVTFFQGASRKVLSEAELEEICKYASEKARETILKQITAEDWYNDVREHAMSVAN
jgi:hypothetical protein